MSQQRRGDQPRPGGKRLLIGNVELTLEDAVLLVERRTAAAAAELDRTTEPPEPVVEHQPSPRPTTLQGGRLLRPVVMAVEQADPIVPDTPTDIAGTHPHSRVSGQKRTHLGAEGFDVDGFLIGHRPSSTP